MDINRVWLSGLCVSQPVITRHANRTPLATFNFQVNETFTDASGTKRTRSNILQIEGVGKAAEHAMSRVNHGMRYQIAGYVRQENRDDGDTVKVRVYSITEDDSADGAVYIAALKQALDVMERSLDLDGARTTIETMLNR